MTMEPSRESVEKYLKKANELLEDAKLLLRENRLLSTADRIYYAMFSAAQAALLSKGIITKTHKGLKAQFSKEFVKTGRISPELVKHLEDAFELRQMSTYEAEFTLDEPVLQEALKRAEEFIQTVKTLIQQG